MESPNVLLRLEFVSPEEKLNSEFLKNKYGEKRKFYSCQKDFNYVSYTDTGSKEKIDYIAYSGNKEKSSGAFNKNGLMTKAQQSELKDKLRNSKSVIWHGFISFKKEFGHQYMTDSKEAMRLLNAEFPLFFKRAGFNPDNITWYAGLHENTQKKHIHISFFENEPTRFRQKQTDENELHYSDGIIYKQALTDFKIRIEQRMTDISAQLKIARKEISSIAENLLFSKENKLKYNKEIQEQLLEIANQLPQEGSLAYNSENMAHLRPNIIKVVDSLFKTNKSLYKAFNRFCAESIKKDESTKKMLIDQKVDEKYWDKYLTANKNLEDIYRRLGNNVINFIRVLKKKENNIKNRLIRKRINKQSMISVLEYNAKLNANIQQEAFNIFNEYLDKLKNAEFNNALGEDESEI